MYLSPRKKLFVDTAAEMFGEGAIITKTQKAEAAKKAGKVAGILLLNPDQVEETIAAGFSFVALGSDGGLVAAGMKQLVSEIDNYR